MLQSHSPRTDASALDLPLGGTVFLGSGPAICRLLFGERRMPCPEAIELSTIRKARRVHSFLTWQRHAQPGVAGRGIARRAELRAEVRATVQRVREVLDALRGAL